MSVPPNVLICETDFPALGIQPGEELATVMRIASTLTALTVASAWSFKKISRLRLFFAHWLSGLMLELGLLVENMMVTLCWTTSNLTGLIKTIKYVELAAGNMLAFTNLAICVNLTFVVLSHRRTSRVKGTTSPPLIGLSLVISMGLAAIAIPFWEGVGVLASGFWIYNTDEGEAKFIVASLWYVEFFIGVCMLFIVTWLVVYRMVEIKHCWKLHVGIRYYFGLTILATIVNLSLGICGSIFLTNGDSWLLVWSNVFRYIHIALDTLVLYGVLRMRGIDERTEGGASSALPSRAPPGVSVAPLAAHAV